MNYNNIAPGIYIYSDVGLLKDFSSLTSFINNGDVVWADRDLNTKVQDIVIYENTESLYLKEIYNKFKLVFEEYENQYLINFNTIKKEAIFSNREIIFFLKYLNETHSVEHFDDLEDSLRRVSVLYYPNDDYEGGEIIFPNFNISIKPKADQILIFPSSYVYSHYVTKVLNGTRYVAGSFLY
jgi:hypothetical protein